MAAPPATPELPGPARDVFAHGNTARSRSTSAEAAAAYRTGWEASPPVSVWLEPIQARLRLTRPCSAGGFIQFSCANQGLAARPEASHAPGVKGHDHKAQGHEWDRPREHSPEKRHPCDSKACDRSSDPTIEDEPALVPSGTGGKRGLGRILELLPPPHRCGNSPPLTQGQRPPAALPRPVASRGQAPVVNCRHGGEDANEDEQSGRLHPPPTLSAQVPERHEHRPLIGHGLSPF
jgi:hypothetical protein